MTFTVDRVTMDYPGVRALSGVSMAFRTGEIHALIGENGAGKSTLLKIMSGIQLPTEGGLGLDGEALHLNSVRAAERAGVAMVHQELNLIDTLSVAENIALGSEPHKLGLLERSKMREAALESLSRLGADIDPGTMVGELSLASKQMVEIAKAVSRHAKFLILDEPTAVLADRETEALIDLIFKLKAEGVGVIYVSHRLEEVCRIADCITVLRDGQVVSELECSDRAAITPHRLASLMVGRELEDFFPPKENTIREELVLDVQNARFEGFDLPVNLQVRAGEIVGLGGLIGSGRTEIAEGIIGKRRRYSGSVVSGEPAYVSEDRKGTGLHLTLDLKENVTMANLPNYGGLTVNNAKQLSSAEGWIRTLGIRTPSPNVFVQSLSGGNQQKVSLAKWLDRNPKLLILDEPTRGVDVGAKAEIYQVIHNLAREGMGCLVISSEINELIGLCHRVIVLRERRVMGELQGLNVNESNIMMLAAGVEHEGAA